MGVCNCSMFCCALLCVHSGNAIVLVGVGWGRAGCFAWFVFLVSRGGWALFLAMVVVFPDHARYYFWGILSKCEV